MFLDTVNRTIEIILGEAASSVEPVAVASYADINQTNLAMTAANSNTATANGTTAVTVVSAPASGYTRQVRYLNVFNADTISHNVTIRLNDNGTLYNLQKVVLLTGQSVVFDIKAGWAIVPNTATDFVPGQLPGTTTNDNAAAGDVGEYKSSVVLQGSGVNPATTTPFNLTSITLTPGDWDLTGLIGLNPSASNPNVYILYGWSNTVSTPGFPSSIPNGLFAGIQLESPVGEVFMLPMSTWRVSVASNTTIYLQGYVAWSTGTMEAWGYLAARRAR